MAKESNFFEPELALAEFGKELVLPKRSQNKPQMLFMLFFGFGLN
jgi:hypothetical protein